MKGEKMKIREFRLGQGIYGYSRQGSFPEHQLYADNSPYQIIGRCVEIGFHIGEIDDPDPEKIRIYMDKEQAKAIIKGLKMAMRGLK